MKSSKNEKEVFVLDKEENVSNSFDLTEKKENSQIETVNSEVEDKKDELIDEKAVESFGNNDELSIAHSKKSKKNSEQFEAMLTTVDNPFDPFDQFDDWFRYDEEKGFHTCSYLGRITQINDEMSDEEYHKAIEKAIDQIIKYDFMNIYKKVKRPIQEEDKTVSKEAVEL